MIRHRWDVVIGAIVASLLTAMAAVWQHRMTRRMGPSSETESWQQVRERFPMPAETTTAPPFAEGLPDMIVQANPFSSDRRPPASPASSTTTQAAAPVPARFAYKGRIMMSGTPRAIMEDVAKKKTHFVQVGQELQGYRVEEIQERAVIVSDLATQESRVIPLATKSPGAPSASPMKP